MVQRLGGRIMEKFTIWSVSGYYLDDESEFDKFLITSTDDCIEDLYGEVVDLPTGLTDDDIFYYGMDVPNEMGNGEFKITSYEVFYEEVQIEE
jgi:hypothetical protein